MDNTVKSGTLWKLHVSPKDGPDPGKQLSDASDDERDRLVLELGTFATEFVTFFESYVVPNVDPEFSRAGRIERILLIQGNNTSTVTDFWLFLDGLMAGDRGVLDVIGERYAVEVEQLGNYTRAGFWDTSSHVVAGEEK
jgi:hypothetical protein